ADGHAQYGAGDRAGQSADHDARGTDHLPGHGRTEEGPDRRDPARRILEAQGREPGGPGAAQLSCSAPEPGSQLSRDARAVRIAGMRTALRRAPSRSRTADPAGWKEAGGLGGPEGSGRACPAAPGLAYFTNRLVK